MAKGAINVQITGDYSDKDIKRAIKDLESLKSQAGTAEKASGGLAAGLKTMALAAGAFVSVSAVTDFMKDAIGAGSDLQESLSKVSVVFGDSADAIIEWSKQSSTAFGQSQQQALESVGTFGNLLQAFGSTASEAQVMSQRMVELAADLASFNNTSVEDALQAIQSGLSGETEPLKRFGVAINDARLKTVAFEKGLYSGKGTLDVYGKSVAAYELILKDTALAQGDFARTSDGLANQQRIISAEFDNLKAALGTGIIEGFGDLDESGGSLVQTMQDLQPAVQEVGKRIGETGADAAFLASQVLSLTDEIANLLPTIDEVTDRTSRSERAMAGFGSTILYGPYGAMGSLADSIRLYQTAVGGDGQALFGPLLRLKDVALDTFGQQEKAVQEAEEAVANLNDEVKALQSTLSNRQAQDDFAKYLRDLDDTIEGNKRTFKGMSDSALENRDVLRTAFSDAADVVQGFVEEGRISEAEFGAVFAGTGKKIVDDLVAQGFSRKDIKAFLKSEGLWTDELAAIFSKGNNKKALDESERLGYDLASGISIGVGNGTPQIKTAMSGTVLSAIQAGKNAAKIKSPSQVTRDEIGLPLAQGIVEGIRAGGDDVRKAMQDNFLSWFKDTKQSLKAELDDAKRMFEDYRSSVSQSIMGGIDFGSIAPEFDESGQRVGMSFIEALNAQAAQAQAFAVKVKELVALGLSQAALTQVLQAGVSAGTNIANELITGGATTIAETNELVATTQAAADEVGLLAANSFYATGVKNAQDTYNGFKANFGQGGPARAALMNLMDNLANSMNRTATITVTTVNRTVNEVIGRYGGERAMGGPVAASTAYLVGERGPELFIPNSAGQIIPNGDLPTASGTFARGGDGASIGGSINLTINAGMGTDGAEVGRQVVEALKAYSRRNGPLPLAVA